MVGVFNLKLLVIMGLRVLFLEKVLPSMVVLKSKKKRITHVCPQSKLIECHRHINSTWTMETDLNLTQAVFNTGHSREIGYTSITYLDITKTPVHTISHTKYINFSYF